MEDVWIANTNEIEPSIFLALFPDSFNPRAGLTDTDPGSGVMVAVSPP
jgi:hypothetical protein